MTLPGAGSRRRRVGKPHAVSETVAGQQPGVDVTYDHDGRTVGAVTMPYWDPDRELGPIDLDGVTYHQLSADMHDDGTVTVSVRPR